MGLIIGVAAGFVQYCLMFRIVNRITQNHGKTHTAVALCIGKLFLWAAVLMGVAFISVEQMLWAAGGDAVHIAGTLAQELFSHEKSIGRWTELEGLAKAINPGTVLVPVLNIQVGVSVIVAWGAMVVLILACDTGAYLCDPQVQGCSEPVTDDNRADGGRYAQVYAFKPAPRRGRLGSVCAYSRALYHYDGPWRTVRNQAGDGRPFHDRRFGADFVCTHLCICYPVQGAYWVP